MKLLIVDDQVSVVAGLRQGIDWAAMGFDQVDCAYNALDARLSLENRPAEVMLCDIEMPVQSGLELLAWVRSQGMETHCIFLSAHAKFDYAQEAVKLGGFDYLVQPAPYSEIERVVARAIAEVKANASQNELLEFGEAFSQQRVSILSGTARRFLRGEHEKHDIKQLEKMGLFPQLDRPGHLILMQPMRWLNSLPWDAARMTDVLDIILSELFEGYQEITVVAHFPASNCFALMLQNRDGEELAAEDIKRQLLFLESACRQYLKCTTAFYLLGPVLVSEMPGMWPKLTAARDDNVSLQPGVFPLRETPHQPHVFRVPQIRGWARLLVSGCADAMEQEGNALLDQLAAKNQLDARTLNAFYRDFMRMLFHAAEGEEDRIYAMFESPEALELYRSGMKSIDQMKALLHHVAVCYRASDDAADQSDVVETIKRYISDHLESDLRRDELAAQVHLNADYLTRIFKKETGVSLKEYVIQQKMQEARHLLRKTNLPVNIIAAQVGYCNFSHFSSTYRRVIGAAPQDDRSEKE